MTAWLDALETLALRAGEAILEVYEQAGAEVTYKDDKSPLTAADLASHEVLVAGLRDLAPDVPILSEEGKAMTFDDRRAWGRFWLVDPLDGTKEFIQRNGEFTVNVALVDGGAPVLGIVHAPVLKRSYLGAHGRGAWRMDGEDGERRPIRASGSGEEDLVVVASRSHAGPDLEGFLAALPSHRLTSMGSSLKLCLVADGSADFYPRLGPTMEWDTGAAHAVVRAAGGEVLDLEGEPLRYNKDNLLNPHFLVVGQRRIPWREALAAAGQASSSRRT